MKRKYGDRKAWLSDDYFRFSSFAESLPPSELPDRLLHAYARYRMLNPAKAEEYVESASCGILISTILNLQFDLSESEAHGRDVSPPLDCALRFFEGRRPYSLELFDAVSGYRDSLRKIRAAAAINTRRSKKTCHTRPGELLEDIEIHEFVSRIDQWFTFPPQQEITVGNAGNAMLRTLIWCGHVTAGDPRVLPILGRLRTVQWKKSSAGTGRKLCLALDWVEKSSAGRQ